MNSTRRDLGLAWLLLATSGAVAFLRAPGLILEPRLWAEEGESFFQYAYHVDFWQGLFYAERYSGGYFLLIGTLPSALAARFCPLESVAAWFTAWAFAVLLLPLAIIAFGKSYVWDTAGRRVAACAVVLFAPTAIGEVWLNITNAQVYLGLASVCILCEDLRGARWSRIGVLVSVLALAGLSGPYTSFLVPAFLFKLALDRSLGTRAHALVVVAAASVQALVFLNLAASGQLHESKLAGYDWELSAVHTAYAQFLAPIFGHMLPHVVGGWFGLDAQLFEGPLGLEHFILGVGAVAWLLLGLALLWPRRLRSIQGVLWVGLLGLAIGTTVGAKNGLAGGRYAVLPGFTLLFLLLAYARPVRGAQNIRGVVAAMLLAFALGLGVTAYPNDPAFECREPCPRWTQEVAHWRRDSTYRMQIWPVYRDRPGSRWVVQLEPGAPPPPPGTVPELRDTP